ncbi:MAG: hydrogenase/urease maturation nickel metallochaperone HypA [Chloroflexi bacterium]|nr:hydrogenase/urease maturation nickel metallochaperone HypA [Chloroflexota bacterium]
MHEAGIARSIAAVLRGRDVAGRRVVLHVRGGHHGPDEFEAALRLHLEIEAPDLELTSFEIVHDPVPRFCVGCGAEFPAARPEDPCPRCGGTSLPLLDREQVEVEIAG